MGSGIDGAAYKTALGGQRQLEPGRRRLERQHQLCREPEQVERRRPGPVSLILVHFGFYFKPFDPLKLCKKFWRVFCLCILCSEECSGAAL